MPIVIEIPNKYRMELAPKGDKFEGKVFRPDGSFARRQEFSKAAVEKAVSDARASGAKVSGSAGGVTGGPQPGGGGGGGTEGAGR
jgi:hypothetical protein